MPRAAVRSSEASSVSVNIIYDVHRRFNVRTYEIAGTVAVAEVGVPYRASPSGIRRAGLRRFAVKIEWTPMPPALLSVADGQGKELQ